ncbi:MAG: GNAT family N-acetyltransferase [Aquihabitans sp.]
MADDVTIEVEDRPQEGRFAVFVDGVDAGGAEYKREGGRRVFDHTEVSDRFEGKGVGGALAKAALKATREAGDQVVPVCDFMREYIERHPEYQDLVDEERLAEMTD